jgi:hypothetical protein
MVTLLLELGADAAVDNPGLARSLVANFAHPDEYGEDVYNMYGISRPVRFAPA